MNRDSSGGGMSMPVQPPRASTQIERVLTVHALGHAVTRIANDTGMHHKTVRTMIHVGAEHRQLATLG
jgi:K+-transporting ATPase c subunit